MNVLTLKQVSASLQVSEDTVMRIIKSGQLGAMKCGKQWRIPQIELNAYIQKRSTKKLVV